MIRTLIVDDHMLVREALCSILEDEPGIAVVGRAAEGESALRLGRELCPDVILLDIGLPDIGGIEVTQRLVAENAAVRVLAVSTHLDRRVVGRMLDAGAAGYIHKAASKQEFLCGVRAVAAGSSYLSRNVSAMMAFQAERKDSQGPSIALRRRETQVLVLIAEGNSSIQIAGQLGIAPSTADVHRRNIMGKLKLHSVVELTRYAVRAGLTSP